MGKSKQEIKFKKKINKKKLTGTVSAVFRSITPPHGRNTVRVVALELIGPAGIIAIDFVGTESAVEGVFAVVVTIAEPGRRDTLAVAALEGRRRTRLAVWYYRSARRSRCRPGTSTVLFVRVIPTVISTIANPRRMDASCRVAAVLQFLGRSCHR